jgi:hypothetical protein
MKYSLFLLEKQVYHGSSRDDFGLFGDYVTEECCIHLETYNTLEEAQIAQKEYKQKTIILNSY